MASNRLLSVSDLRVLFPLARTARRANKEKVSSEIEVSLVGGITSRKILISRLLIIIPLRYGFIVVGRAKRFAAFFRTVH